MKWQRNLLVLVLVIFLFFNLRALMAFNYPAIVDQILLNQATQLVGLDLVISLTLVLIWIHRDAKALGGSAFPFTVITLLYGVAGPLTYLLLRKNSKRVQMTGAIVVLTLLLGFAIFGQAH